MRRLNRALLCKNSDPCVTGWKLAGRFRSINVNKDVDRFREHVCDARKKKTKKCTLTSWAPLQIFPTAPPITQQFSFLAYIKETQGAAKTLSFSFFFNSVSSVLLESTKAIKFFSKNTIILYNAFARTT